MSQSSGRTDSPPGRSGSDEGLSWGCRIEEVVERRSPVFAERQVTKCGQYGLHMALRVINLSLQSSWLLLSAGRVERCSPSRRRHP